MSDDCTPDSDSMTSRVHDSVTTTVGDRLNDRSYFCGLKWSPDMPDDEPDADFLVIDESGTEYTLEIDVWLHATGKSHNQEEMK